VLVDGPADAVAQVVLHRPSAPLLVAGVEEALAEAGGAAEVDLQDRIAAVGEPLGVGVVAPAVAPPGAAVHSQHQGQSAGLEAHGQGEVARQLQPVPCPDHHRLHGRQPIRGKPWSVDEQALERLLVPLVEEMGPGAVVGLEGDHPAIGFEGPAGDGQAPFTCSAQVGEVIGHGGIDHLPARLEVLEAGGLHVVRGGVHEHAGDIGAGVVGEDPGLLAGGGVDGDQPGGVRAEGARHEQALAVCAEAMHGAVLPEGPTQDLPPRAVHRVPHPQNRGAALAVLGHGGADAERGVGNPAGDVARVARVESALAGVQVHAVHVEDARVPAVEADEHLAGVVLVGDHVLGPDPLQGRQITRLAVFQAHRVQVPVLIAAPVLEVEDSAAVTGPGVEADAAAGVVGDAPRRIVGTVHRAHPDVQHSLLRGGEPGQMPAVRRELRLGADRVAEQDLAGNQIGELGRRVQEQGRREDGEQAP
jgi:hypothetical protein